jgi:hypothetical protein
MRGGIGNKNQPAFHNDGRIIPITTVGVYEKNDNRGFVYVTVGTTQYNKTHYKARSKIQQKPNLFKPAQNPTGL